MRVLLFFIALTGLSLFTSAQKKQDKVSSRSQASALFDTYIQSALQTWKTPGLSVAVVKDGNIVFKKAYGVKELGNPDIYTTSTLSTCASTTKAMTAVCMAMLVDEGKIKWTDIVTDVLPEFKLSDPYITSQVTVKDLFTHNAGLGNADLLWVFGYPRSEILHRMQAIPLAYSLRASFIYQNLMYMTAGEVIKKISEEKKGIVFLLWGRFAQDKQVLIDETKHHVLKAAHPSPFSADKGFFGCRHFSKTNELLMQQGDEPIDWKL